MEIELKLATDEHALDKFERLVLPALKGQIKRESFDLRNDYYDTLEQILGKRKMGCRVRQCGAHIEQTIKTQGQVIGGLHQRPEYNVDLQDAQPDLRKFDADIFADDFDLEQINRDLKCQFSTHFHRVAFDIVTQDAHIELVFDSGEVKTTDESLPISEIELELKSGEASSLFDLADEISAHIPLRLSNTTKAARGYQLLNNTLPATLTFPAFLPLNRQESTEEALCKAMSFALSHWQHHEYVYLQTRHLKALNEIASSIELLLQAVSLYLPILQCQELLNLHKQLLVLTQEWRWQEDLTCIRTLRSRKGPFSRRLPKHQLLMSYLNGRREGLLSAQSPENLLMSMHSCQVQLTASRMLVEKPWRTQIGSSDESVMKHAKGWLSQGWQTVMQSMPSETKMDCHSYLSLEILLRHTLLNGFLLADLFIENRSKFRAPWLDLLDGIDEIKALFFLKDVLNEIDIEDQAEMHHWIAEKLNNVITVMEKSRKVAMSAEAYW